MGIGDSSACKIGQDSETHLLRHIPVIVRDHREVGHVLLESHHPQVGGADDPEGHVPVRIQAQSPEPQAHRKIRRGGGHVVGADPPLEVLDPLDAGSCNEVIGQEDLQPHDHRGVRPLKPGVHHGRARAMGDLELPSNERHERLRRALDVDEAHLQAVLLEDAGLPGNPQDRGSASVG